MIANRFAEVTYLPIRQIAVPVEFHGFNFRPGFIWGREPLTGAEFAASGWQSHASGEVEVFIYRRHGDGSWHGSWEHPDAWFTPFEPASPAAQMVLWMVAGEGDD